ncbi:hypothetical protein MTO96_012495 [Rhipicephalus appendiculatus]
MGGTEKVVLEAAVYLKCLRKCVLRLLARELGLDLPDPITRPQLIEAILALEWDDAELSEYVDEVWEREEAAEAKAEAKADVDLKSLRKHMLLRLARELGLDVLDSLTRPELIEKIVESGAEDDELSECVKLFREIDEAEGGRKAAKAEREAERKRKVDAEKRPDDEDAKEFLKGIWLARSKRSRELSDRLSRIRKAKEGLGEIVGRVHQRSEALQRSSQPCISVAVEPSPEKEGVVDTPMTEQIEIAVAPEPPPSSTEDSTEGDSFQARELAAKATVAEATDPQIDNEPSHELERVIVTPMTKQQVRELATKAIVAETIVPRGDGEPSPEKEWLIDTPMTEQQVQQLAPKATVAETTRPKGDNEPSPELEGVIDALLTEQLETAIAPEPILSSTEGD